MLPPLPDQISMGVGAQRTIVMNDESTHHDPRREDDDSCSICMDGFTKMVTLDKCKHSFCKACIEQAMKIKPVCPVCITFYGKIEGNQPKNGTMSSSVDSKSHLPGHEEYGTIIIKYNFPHGVQKAEHSNPGVKFYGARRTAYLPDSPEGRHVLSLLEKAFTQRLIFTVGTSTTTGLQNCVTWNDIHHKTSKHGGPESYGYPDPDYLHRVKEELKANGIY
ncbi:probable E3 ubiquitin-protein ligase DTX3 isoform X2 [Lethenteron reissneri]|uniref:probable E3 ubiquitin-protein ligase DTX3 isoform X2 n=1 Tax=Lethenteron reissneri TaxID=7753 RepID=UPI002AB5EDAB|nr:probable E3 ubiquitin-protein ligase DTX3 isoform X2 [Lethenteron reissneri]